MNIYNLFPYGIYNKSIQLDLSFDNPIWWLKILILFCVLLSYYYMTIDHFKENYIKQSSTKPVPVVKNNTKKFYKNKKKVKKRKLKKNKKTNKNKNLNKEII